MTCQTTYEHVLSNQASCRYVNKEVDVNAKGANGEMHLHLACGNNLDGIVSFYAWCSISYLLFFCFMDHKLYKFV
jgi:hypothetical protein